MTVVLGADSLELLEEAREALGRRAWRQSRPAVAAAPRDELSVDDIEHRGVAAHLIGIEIESRELLTCGHHETLARGDITRAVRVAYWLGHSMIFTGEPAQASGWWSHAPASHPARGGLR
jgi:hypothetical protein